MNRTNQTIRYLTYSLKWMFLIELLVAVGIVLLTDYIFLQTGGSDLSQSAMPGTVRLTAVVFSILIGFLYIRPNFRVALANGISRKTFILAYLPVAGLVAVVFAITSQLIVGVHNWIWPTPSAFGVFINFKLVWLWSFVAQAALCFLLIMSSWFISFLYYRCNTIMKWVISLLVGLIFCFPIIAPEFYSMSISPTFHDFLMWCLFRPERFIIIMLAFSVLFYEGTYLLIYRAPLKD